MKPNISKAIQTIPKNMRAIAGLFHIGIVAFLANAVLQLIQQILNLPKEILGFTSMLIVLVTFVTYGSVGKTFFNDMTSKEIKTSSWIAVLFNVILLVMQFIFPNLFSIFFMWVGSIGIIIIELSMILPQLGIIFLLTVISTLFLPLMFPVISKDTNIRKSKNE